MGQKGKQMSWKERESRLHSKRVRAIADWCEENGITLQPYEQADNYDVCVASMNEYEQHEFRRDCVSGNKSWFLNPSDYEKWCDDESL